MADLDFLIEAGFLQADVEKAKSHFGDNANVEQVAEWILSGCPGYDADKNATKDVFVAETPPNQSSGWWSDDDANKAKRSHADIAEWAAASNKVDEVRNAAFAREQWKTWDGSSTNTAPQSDNQVVKYAPDAVMTSRAGQPSPVDNTSGKTRETVIDLTGDTPAEKPKPGLLALAEAATGTNEEDDIQRAIRMSLEDQGNLATPYAASAQMSRAVSATREEQESEQLAAALTASMADLEAATPAAGGMSTSVTAEVPPATRIRMSADAPIVLAPPGGFLAYIGPVIYSLFCNIPFRNAVLGIDIEWLPTFTYEDYADEVPAPGDFTRDLVTNSGDSDTLRVAALQRLFAFMMLSKRANMGVVDLMDAFDIRKLDRPPTNALAEVRGMSPISGCGHWRV